LIEFALFISYKAAFSLPTLLNNLGADFVTRIEAIVLPFRDDTDSLLQSLGGVAFSKKRWLYASILL
jgi:hypothetical protein